MSKRNPRQYDDDDGRTICDMNVPGMPWYSEIRSAHAETNDAHSGAMPSHPHRSTCMTKTGSHCRFASVCATHFR